MEPEKETVQAALLYCCGRFMGHAVEHQMRQTIVEPTITTNTRYKKIIWEDLLLIERMKNEEMDSNP